MALENRNIILGVTGGIAAYKAAQLCSLLQKSGANIRVAMTASAEEFIAPLTFETLTQYPVYRSILNTHDSYKMEHIGWARWADALVIAPATATTIARLSAGLADDAVTSLALCFTGPVFVAPAMNTQMLLHPATQHNIETLRQRGVHVIDSGSGALACGEVGPGRLAEPEDIVRVLDQFNWQDSSTPREPSTGSELLSARPYSQNSTPPAREQSLAGKTVLITSGPTHEQIDSVRFLSNPSSGKMGAALAREAAWRGATVHLVSGPVSRDHMPSNLATVHHVTTAEQMLHTVQSLAQLTDIFIFAAAVSDFRPAHPVHHKIKRTGNSLSLPLVENPDISQAIGYTKSSGQVTIGFAAETDNLEDHAKAKLERKNLDAIVANNVADETIGFGSDENEVTIYLRDGNSHHIPRATKDQIAREIFNTLTPLLAQAQPEGRFL